MRGLTATVVIAAALAGCASSSVQPPAAGPVFALWSPAFADGAHLEQRHAGNVSSNPNCIGRNDTPPLAWANVPPGTRSFAVLVYDQQGRNGLGVVHWVAYNIPATVNGFTENEIGAPSAKYTGGKSTLNLPHYMGPCPPVNTGKHYYLFTIIATNVEPGSLPAGLTMQELTERLNGRAKGSSSMVLRYGRP